MQLVVLVLIFIIFGYLLAGSQSVKRLEKSTQAGVNKTSKWFRNLFKRSPKGFREWALGQGAEYFSKDWRQWLAGLSTQEAERFEQELSDYFNQKGYTLNELIAGEQQPARIEIFVEAVTVYSREYRKAQAEGKKKERSKSPQPKKVENEQVEPATERAVAEKQPSRRRTPVVQSSGD